MAAAKKDDGKADAKKMRDETGAKLDALGNRLVEQVEQGENLHIDIPVRGSSNVSFNEKSKKIELGDKVARRYLFNVAHARRFMQTMLVASYVKKDLLASNLTATLRDLYYAKKHTIKGTKEDTIDEQKESDLAIVDLEVSLDTFRERLHLRAEPKGRMAGDMVVLDRVKDKIDSIDLSHMGSGGWAVPSIVEQIEFKDVGVEYVLVAEKNAIFDRLNEDEYWKKQKCLLMTTAGQAARGARRLLQRLSSELKLPIYCLSVDACEPITVTEDGIIRRPLISEYADRAMAAYGAMDCGYYEKSISFGSSQQVDSLGKLTESRIMNAVRHPVAGDLIEVTAESGYCVRVTASHSLKVFDAETFEVVSKRACDLGSDDYLVSTSRVPTSAALSKIDLVQLVRSSGAPERFYALAEFAGSAKWVKLPSLAEGQRALAIRYGKSEVRLPSGFDASPELCRLLGYYVAEGNGGDCVNLTFGGHERGYAEDASKIAKDVLGVRGSIREGNSSLRVSFGGKGCSILFEELLGIGSLAENKRVPWPVYNASFEAKKEFLRGYFRGDGSLRFSKRGCKLQASTVSRALASDIVYLVHQLGGWAHVEKKASRKANELDKYHILISDKESLKTLAETVMDLGRADRDGLWEYLHTPSKKLSVRRSIPSAVVKKVQRALFEVTGRGIARLVGNQTRISLDKLADIFGGIGDSPSSVLPGDLLLKVLPAFAPDAMPTSKAAVSAGVKFITAFKALKRLEKSGKVSSIRRKGDLLWFKKPEGLRLGEGEVRNLLVLKNLVDSGIVLLAPRKIEKIKPTTGIVYDIELSPTHSFAAGVGGLLVSNTDADPYGWYIYSTMKYGSMALAHESDRLGSRDMKFLGMSISDIEHYDLRNVTIKAKDVDIKRAEEMKAYDWFKAPAWQREIDKFLEKKIKAEIQSLSSKNLQYISNTYLPEKIKSQDFLP